MQSNGKRCLDLYLPSLLTRNFFTRRHKSKSNHDTAPLLFFIIHGLGMAADAPELDEVILAALADGVVEDTWAWAATRAVDHQRIVGAVKSLEAEGYVTADATTTEILALTAEAEGYVARGSPEAQLFAALPAGGSALTEAELEAAFSKEFVAIAKGKALKNKWIARDAASGAYRRAVEAVGRDELVEQLGSVRAGDTVEEKLVKDLLKRKLVERRCARASRLEEHACIGASPCLRVAANARPFVCPRALRTRPYGASCPPTSPRKCSSRECLL